MLKKFLLLGSLFATVPFIALAQDNQVEIKAYPMLSECGEQVQLKSYPMLSKEGEDTELRAYPMLSKEGQVDLQEHAPWR